jgi:hypothetical protein
MSWQAYGETTNKRGIHVIAYIPDKYEKDSFAGATLNENLGRSPDKRQFEVFLDDESRQSKELNPIEKKSQ